MFSVVDVLAGVAATMYVLAAPPLTAKVLTEDEVKLMSAGASPVMPPEVIITERLAVSPESLRIRCARPPPLETVTVPLTQGQHDAMVSIVYNVGIGSSEKDGIIVLRNGKPSTLLRKLNAGDYDGAADQFLLWISPGSNVENGLKRRRTQERCMFLTGRP